MSFAVIVDNATKKFCKPAEPFWQRILAARSANGKKGNGHNGNGQKNNGHSGNGHQPQVIEILTRLGLEKKNIMNPMEEMSRGMQQKVAIARALLSHPRLLLLDEPTTGLDPRSKREVQAVISKLKNKFGTTILLTTHDMVEAETLCDRIAIMDSGKVVALDTPAGLSLRLPVKDGKPATLEDTFMELTGKQLRNKDEEESS